jgi:hypothetical protein
VTDSTLREHKEFLYALSCELGAIYTTLEARPPLLASFPLRNRRRRFRYDLRRFAGFLRPPGRRRASTVNSHPHFAKFYEWLARDASLLVTGRFHGVCLALALEIPVLAIASNSHKVQGLLEDVGLRHRLINGIPKLRATLLGREAGEFIFTAEELSRIRTFREQARHQARAMFHSIAEDARRLSEQQPNQTGFLSQMA